jgi:hypothetical protein
VKPGWRSAEAKHERRWNEIAQNAGTGARSKSQTAITRSITNERNDDAKDSDRRDERQST